MARLASMVEAAPDSFASELRREILRSEVQRMRVLAITLTILLGVTLTVINVFPELAVRLFRGGLEPWIPLAGIGPFVVYEFSALAYLRWRIARGLDFPRIARFANALIETSLPSVIIFALSQHMDPATVFGFWPPMLYFLFILLSTLRLDFWLSVWTGSSPQWSSSCSRPI